jgi:AraC-like DNA-binding protein
VTDDRQRKDPMARLLLLRAGTATLICGKLRARLIPGAVAAVPAAIAHRVVGKGAFEWTLIRFDPEAIRMQGWDIVRTPEFIRCFPALIRRTRLRRPVSVVHLIPRHMDQAVAIEGEIARELSELRPGWQDLSVGHFQHLLILLSRFADTEMRASSEAMDRVGAAIRRIEAQCMKELDLAEIAGSSGMSPRTFYRIFHQATGQAPKAYLKRVRIERAAEMLRTTDASVTEIAYAVGFDDSNFFAREFRKGEGHSPTEYRRRWQT